MSFGYTQIHGKIINKSKGIINTKFRIQIRRQRNEIRVEDTCSRELKMLHVSIGW